MAVKLLLNCEHIQSYRVVRKEWDFNKDQKSIKYNNYIKCWILYFALRTVSKFSAKWLGTEICKIVCEKYEQILYSRLKSHPLWVTILGIFVGNHIRYLKTFLGKILSEDDFYSALFWLFYFLYRPCSSWSNARSRKSFC